jgi:hypothetical protein
MPEGEHEEEPIERPPVGVRPTGRDEGERRLGRDVEKVRDEEVAARQRDEKDAGDTHEVPDEPFRARDGDARALDRSALCN